MSEKEEQGKSKSSVMESLTLNLDHKVSVQEINIAEVVKRLFELDRELNNLGKSALEMEKRLEFLGLMDLLKSEDPGKHMEVVHKMQRLSNYQIDEVSVYLGKAEGHEEVQQALLRLIEVSGYMVEESWKPVIASWSWKAWLKFPVITPKERAALSEVKRKIKIGLDQALLDKQRAEIDSILASSTASVIASLKDQDEAVIQIGGILVVKNVIDGEPKLIVKTLSSIELDELRSNPELLKSPKEIIERLESRTKFSDSLDKFLPRMAARSEKRK